MTFRVGQKVVCVDMKTKVSPVSTGWNHQCDLPKEGSIYEVRDVGLTPYGQPGIKLHGMVAVARYGGALKTDTFYSAFRFRPVVERKTSIELFHQIRRDVENNVPAQSECV